LCHWSVHPGCKLYCKLHLHVVLLICCSICMPNSLESTCPPCLLCSLPSVLCDVISVATEFMVRPQPPGEYLSLVFALQIASSV
jgi:hypothetical protein